MKTVLITGASGYIGSNVREHLFGARDFKVVGMDRVDTSRRFEGEVLERCDLLDIRQVESLMRWHKPDAVLHFAAQARVDPSLLDPLDTYQLNVEATLNVMRACKTAGVGQLCVASSEAIYGKARKYPTAENDDFNPANPYAASKVAVDVLCQQFNRILPTCVIRSGMGWGGKGQDPKAQVTAKFITKALRGEDLLFPPTDGFPDRTVLGPKDLSEEFEPDGVTPTRDLNNVEDFAHGVEAIIRKKATGVFNLSGGREYSVLEIARRIVSAVGRGRVRFDANYSWREGEVGFRTWLDISKAKRDLGHEPRHHLEGDALNRTMRWYAENYQ